MRSALLLSVVVVLLLAVTCALVTAGKVIPKPAKATTKKIVQKISKKIAKVPTKKPAKAPVVAVALPARKFEMGASDTAASDDWDLMAEDDAIKCKICTIDCAQFAYFYNKPFAEVSNKEADMSNLKNLQCKKRFFNYGCNIGYACFSANSMYNSHIKTAAVFCMINNGCTIDKSWTQETFHEWSYQMQQKRLESKYAYVPERGRVKAWFRNRLLFVAEPIVMYRFKIQQDMRTAIYAKQTYDQFKANNIFYKALPTLPNHIRSIYLEDYNKLGPNLWAYTQNSIKTGVKLPEEKFMDEVNDAAEKQADIYDKTRNVEDPRINAIRDKWDALNALWILQRDGYLSDLNTKPTGF